MHKHCLTQCVAGLPSNTHIYKVSRGKRAWFSNALLRGLHCWGNGAIMTRDERATMVSSPSLMFHCSMKKKLLAFSCARWGKHAAHYTQSRDSKLSEWDTEREGQEKRILAQQSMNGTEPYCWYISRYWTFWWAKDNRVYGSWKFPCIPLLCIDTILIFFFSGCHVLI